MHAMGSCRPPGSPNNDPGSRAIFVRLWVVFHSKRPGMVYE